MLKLAKLYRKIFRRRGQTAVEYALIIGGVGFVLWSVMNSTLKPAMKTGMGTLSDNVKSVLETGDTKK